MAAGDTTCGGNTFSKSAAEIVTEYLSGAQQIEGLDFNI